jgi:hypothetical protein
MRREADEQTSIRLGAGHVDEERLGFLDRHGSLDRPSAISATTVDRLGDPGRALAGTNGHHCSPCHGRSSGKVQRCIVERDRASGGAAYEAERTFRRDGEVRRSFKSAVSRRVAPAE